MSGLLDHTGNPIKYARSGPVAEPMADREFGQWAGRDAFFANLPGGGILQFDLSRLTLADFRSMRTHYQLGASLNVLTFIMHQIDWGVECENQEIADFIEGEIRDSWTPLIFALSQAFWAGYSPIAVNYENRDGYVRIKRFKDLVPEECAPNWKEEAGWAPPGRVAPKLYSYDGFTQNGHLVPVENTLWYPLLAESGDHWGRKLLKPAFPAWFFSNLIHLYANRYFERFGEPLPVGRAPFDDDVQMGDGNYVSGKRAMELIVSNIRNRAVTVLPSDRDPDKGEYQYDIEYLESQMRGADFERYLGRLDEEMSLAVFTPILLFRTADVGSYNLGQAHLKIFEQMLNAVTGDVAFYLQRYLVDRLRVVNFGQDSPRAQWTFRRLGTVDLGVYKEIVVEMIRQKSAKLDVTEMGKLIGVGMEELEILTEPPAPPAPDDSADEDEDQPPIVNARAPLAEAVARAVRENAKGNPAITLGFKKRFANTLIEQDKWNPERAAKVADTVYGHINSWLSDTAGVFTEAERMKAVLENLVDAELTSAV